MGVWGWRAGTRREKESGKDQQQHNSSTKGTGGGDGDDALLKQDRSSLIACLCGRPISSSLVLQVTHGRRRASASSTIQSSGVLRWDGWTHSWSCWECAGPAEQAAGTRRWPLAARALPLSFRTGGTYLPLIACPIQRDSIPPPIPTLPSFVDFRQHDQVNA